MNQLKKIGIFVVLSLLVFSASASAQNNQVRFNDVPEGHWAEHYVHQLRELKVTEGMGNNVFGMGLTLKRSEFVTLLVKLMGWELIIPKKGSFVDNMDSAQWYYGPIETALEHGVIIKDGDRFRVDDPITREEIAMMIVRTLGYDTLANQLTYLGSPFDDVSKNTGYITMAKDFGIIAGVGNGLFHPDHTAKREEAAVMMIKMYEKLNNPLKELHGFYAIRSAHQSPMINSLHSVGFGWSRLEYDNEMNQVVLNTTRKNNNEFLFPVGFEEPFKLAKESNVSTQLMVFAKNDTLTPTGVPLIEYIVTNAEVRKQVIDSIGAQLNVISSENTNISFDGVVIDFENMKGEGLKQSFNGFLRELKQELNKNNKLLYVAVHPARRPGQAYFDSYDFKTIGEISDKVILMAHDYYAKQLTDAEMQRGYTTTPLTPIDEIYYALKAITDKETGVQDLSKIMLQFSMDSVQWKLKDGKVLNRVPFSPSYEAIQQRLVMEGVTINYASRIQNPYATFFDPKDETDNIIWYEDARSIQAKIDLAKMFDIKGISLWRLGNIPDYTEPDTKRIYLDIWGQLLSNLEN